MEGEDNKFNSSRKNSGNDNEDEDKDKGDGDKSCNEWLPTEEGKEKGQRGDGEVASGGRLW